MFDNCLKDLALNHLKLYASKWNNNLKIFIIFFKDGDFKQK